MNPKLNSRSDREYQRLLARLITLRREAGFSQGDLAARLGWTRTKMKQIEDGKLRLDPVEFHQLCKAVGQDDTQLIQFLL